MGIFLYVPIVLIAVYYALRYYFTRNFNYWKDRNVCYPEPNPVFGNMKDLTLRRKFVGLVYQDMYNMFPNEKVVGIFRMTTPCLLVRDLDIIKQIMIKDFDMFIDRGFDYSKKGLGVNLFHADGDSWSAPRSRFTPLFTANKLKNMYYLIDECADQFVEIIYNECCTNPEQDIRAMVQKYTTSTICACAFGIDIKTLHDKLDTLKELDALIFTPNYAMELDMMYQGILKTLNVSAFPEKIKEFFSDLVKKVIQQRNGKPSNRKDFMDLILELREAGNIKSSKFGNKNHLEITDDLVEAQAFIFYVAGYETSATTMTYLLHEIAVNQHVQDKLIEEIDKSLAENDGKITYDTLKDMKYLDKVFNETLRLHSIVEPLQRQARTDYKIPGTDITVKKGQIVFISPRSIHYDETFWPSPEVFDPERFSPEVAGNRHPCAYLPFGIGPRNCIGARFGQVQSRLGVTKLLSKFRVELAKNTAKVLDVDPNRVLTAPMGGVHLKLIPRLNVLI